MKVRSKAPLRLGFAGGGTDLLPYSSVYGGAVLNATINLYAHCTLVPSEDGNIHFMAMDLEESFDSPTVSELPIGSPCLLHRGVYNHIVKEFNEGVALPICLITYSDAPAGSGLGTSSTLVVALIKAFVEYLNLPLGEYEIASLAYQIEREELGLAGGKQDQYATSFGGFNLIEFKKDGHVIVNPLRLHKWFIDELHESLVLCFTGKSRASGDIIKKQIKDTSENKDDNLKALHEIKKSTIRMKNALLRADIKKMSEEIAFGWEQKKKTCNEISNPLIEDLITAAMDAGAMSAKISGAGGGGFIMFMVHPTRRIKVINALREKGGHISSFEFVFKGAEGWHVYDPNKR